MSYHLPNHHAPLPQQLSHAFFRLIAITLLSLIPMLSPAPALLAQNVTPTNTKLTPDAVAGGSFGNHKITPDGSHLVYKADQDTFGVNELYSVPMTGGAAVKLNGPLVAGGNVSGFYLSPDSQWVVYHADQEVDGMLDFYSVPIGGGTPAKLSLNVPADSNVVGGFNPISPDSQSFVYSYEKKGDFRDYALVSVPINGGTPVVLTPPLVEGGEIYNFSLSKNSQRVIYTAKQDNANITELYSVPIAGGAATKLSIPLVDGENIESGVIYNDGAGVIYYVNKSSGTEIYSVPVEGGTSIRINDAEGVPLLAVWSTNAGNTVLYATTAGSPFSGNATYALYAKSLSDSTSLKLSSPEDTEGTNTGFAYVSGFSEDRQQVFFVVGTSTGSHIYRVSIAGGANVKVAGPIEGSSFQLTNDQSKVVYGVYPFGSANPARLYSIDLATGQSITLDEVQITGSFSSFYWTLIPDHTGAIYFGSKGGSKKQLYYVPLTGGTPTVLSADYSEMDPPPLEPAVQPVSYNGQTCVVYGFQYSSSSYRSLYSSCFSGAATPQQNVYLPLISQ